ncbi:unnamed protein product, partial [Prunus brigantina]
IKHISLSPSTELAKIDISVTSFRTPSSPRSPSPSRCSVHRARCVRHLPRFTFAYAHVNTIHELSVVMSIDFSKTVNEVHPSLSDHSSAHSKNSQVLALKGSYHG